MLIPAVGAHAASVLQGLPSWRQLNPASNPGQRAGTAMAYDGKEIVLFGGGVGGGSGTAFGDTWIWDGSNWTQVTGLTSGTTAPTP